ACVGHHGAEHTLVKPHEAGHAFGDDSLEADCGQIPISGDGTGAAKLAEAILNRLRILGHPLEAALVNEALGAVHTVEQPPLDRSRTEVGDKNLHGCGARSAGSRSRSAVHSAFRVPHAALTLATCRAP